jgi:hypothetical protein
LRSKKINPEMAYLGGNRVIIGYALQLHRAEGVVRIRAYGGGQPARVGLEGDPDPGSPFPGF